MDTILAILEKASPIGALALALVIILQLVIQKKNNKRYQEIDDSGQPITLSSLNRSLNRISINHFHELDESLRRMENQLIAINLGITEIRTGIEVIKTKMNNVGRENKK